MQNDVGKFFIMLCHSLFVLITSSILEAYMKSTEMRCILTCLPAVSLPRVLGVYRVLLEKDVLLMAVSGKRRGA